MSISDQGGGNAISSSCAYSHLSSDLIEVGPDSQVHEAATRTERCSFKDQLRFVARILRQSCALAPWFFRGGGSEIAAPEMPALAMLPMVALSVAALHARLHVAGVASRVPGARRAVRMSTAEEEAKRAWMAKQERETGSTPRVSNEEAQATMQAANAAARARGLAAMGGKDALRSGKMQGFGVEDTEYYGYGEQLMEMPDDREIDLLTGKPLSQGGDYDPRAQGFGGRSAGWARKPETTPSSSPPMEGTLRAPGQVRLTLTLSPSPSPTLSLSPTLPLFLTLTLALTLTGAGAALAAGGARAGVRVWLRRRRYA